MNVFFKKYGACLIGIIFTIASNNLVAEEIRSLANIAQGLQPEPTCPVNDGLELLAKNQPPLDKIQKIIATCDQKMPDDVQVLLLHGLFARKAAMQTKNYEEAIFWLLKAKHAAAIDNLAPALELAVTYEWAMKFNEAKTIYKALLNQHPDSRAASLGLARIAIAQGDPSAALQIDQKLLQKNPHDVDALNNLARAKMANKEFIPAEKILTDVLLIKPNNQEAMVGLAQLKKPQSYVPITANKNTPPPIVAACPVNKGLALLNQPTPPLAEIKTILAQCDQKMSNNVQVLLLHGLLARKEAMRTKNYQTSISWLLKAEQAATIDNHAPALELAVTYGWAKQFNRAESIYKQLLHRDPKLREAWLGWATILVAKGKIATAIPIYQKLLQKNPQDTDALSGLARTKLANKEFAAAKKMFTDVLRIKPHDQDALIGLAQAKAAENSAHAVSKALPRAVTCPVNEGLALLNEQTPPFPKINAILAECDEKMPNDVQVLLLHGLLARKVGMADKNYQCAIFWLQKAQAAAAANNHSPSFELAVTYLWAKQFKKAKEIYQCILASDCNSTIALSGLADVELAQYHINNAMCLYKKLLGINCNDTKAWVGLGTAELTNKQFKRAKKDFNQALEISPGDNGACSALETLKNATRYRLDFLAGIVDVGGLRSYNGDIDLFADLNATDQLLLFLSHNSKEIQSGSFFDPTLLPKNSAAIGFQRQVPDQHGWGISYEHRERTNQPLEHRIFINGNVYLLPNLKLFGAAREGFPSPWNNQLYLSGLTLFTKMPTDITVTGYLGEDEFGGQTTAYALDFSKEFANHAFYDVGSAYSPTPQRQWEVHGTLVLPITKNQAVEAIYEHYFSNGGTTYFTVGWRIYW